MIATHLLDAAVEYAQDRDRQVDDLYRENAQLAARNRDLADRVDQLLATLQNTVQQVAQAANVAAADLPGGLCRPTAPYYGQKRDCRDPLPNEPTPAGHGEHGGSLS